MEIDVRKIQKNIKYTENETHGYLVIYLEVFLDNKEGIIFFGGGYKSLSENFLLQSFQETNEVYFMINP